MKRFPWWAFVLPLPVIAAMVLAPLVLPVLAGMAAEDNDCLLELMELHRCIINGIDYGSQLQAMEFSAWLGVVTIPLGIVLFLGWLAALVVHCGRRRARA